MIDKLSYDEILTISNELKKEAQKVLELATSRNITEIIDFANSVDGYSKYLENTVGINKDADNALKELKEKLK